MTVIGLSTVLNVLSIVGLVVGVVVLGVVIFLLQDVLTPLRRILTDVEDAKTAPLLEHGVRGADQLDRTRRLAESVVDPAVRYLQKLGLPVNTEPPGANFPERGAQRSWR